MRRYYDNNKDALLEKGRKYYSENKEDCAAQNREYRAKNKEKLRPFSVRDASKRRAAKQNAVPPWYGELDLLVELEAADLCQRRRESTGIEWEVDHMIALRSTVACGLHCAINLQVITRAQNRRKKNKMILTEPGEWILALP